MGYLVIHFQPLSLRLGKNICKAPGWFLRLGNSRFPRNWRSCRLGILRHAWQSVVLSAALAPGGNSCGSCHRAAATRVSFPVPTAAPGRDAAGRVGRDADEISGRNTGSTAPPAFNSAALAKCRRVRALPLMHSR